MHFLRKSLENPHNQVAVQQAHAADRFAREIVGFLTVAVVRSRRLMGRPLDGSPYRRLAHTTKFRAHAFNSCQDKKET